MKTINVNKLVDELEEHQKNYNMNDQFSFTVNESAVIAQTLDLVIDSIKEAITHAHITIEEETE